ncbi:hypothetical protein [Acinetobacter baumannii]|uniref:hypothetical protein n=1 Tax=Acinetobacter baumannii TaxID=470 RepID=UPI0003069409
MSNLQFNGGQTPQRTIPNASTDKGHVLWSLIRQGAQTGEELRANTSVLGCQSRISNLLSENYIPIFTTPETKTRPNGKVVPIVRYHINFGILNIKDQEWVDFLLTGDNLYGA